jgi:hypothetical protein
MKNGSTSMYLKFRTFYTLAGIRTHGQILKNLSRDKPKPVFIESVPRLEKFFDDVGRAGEFYDTHFSRLCFAGFLPG